MDITRQQAIALTAEIEAAVAEIFERHGLEKAKTRTTYGIGYTLKLEAAIKADDPDAEFNPNSREAQAFTANAQWYDLSADDLGRHFRSQGREFVIVGLSTRSPKRPILATDVADGRTYKFPEASVKAALSLPASS